MALISGLTITKILNLNIATDIDAMDKKTISTHEFSEYEDRYQVFAMIAFGFLIIGFIFPTRSRINK